MSDQQTKAQQFAELHRKGDPVIIYNAWDGGSAKAILAAGAKAIATGDHPVGFAHGYDNDNFDEFSFEPYLGTIKEIAARVGDVPFSVDINNANNLQNEELAERIKTLLEIGVVGINFEDGLSDGSGVLPAEEQAERIRTIRQAADQADVALFINARTDIFAQADKAKHADLIDEAVSRAQMYKDAGANGFFTPGLMDVELITKLVDQIDLPLNIIRLPGAPESRDLADAGVSRISYGPVPQMEMTEWLKDKATAAFNL